MRKLWNKLFGKKLKLTPYVDERTRVNVCINMQGVVTRVTVTGHSVIMTEYPDGNGQSKEVDPGWAFTLIPPVVQNAIEQRIHPDRLHCCLLDQQEQT